GALPSDVMPSSSGSATSDPSFLTHHALRIKGFARIDTLADMTELDVGAVESHLRAMSEHEWAMYREARSLWQLTPQGRQAHVEALAADVRGLELSDLASLYTSFLVLNEAFKQLCGDWQLRDGEVNDHSDLAYDRAVIGRLVDLHAESQLILGRMSEVVPRLRTYSPRLEATCEKVRDGVHQMFTGVMCGSFHDVWMELHEDLILTQGIDRAAEGSF
ncbi:MAG: hypothetical protein RIS41_2046, partial [Actinomycetota bacterium]